MIVLVEVMVTADAGAGQDEAAWTPGACDVLERATVLNVAPDRKWIVTCPVILLTSICSAEVKGSSTVSTVRRSAKS